MFESTSTSEAGGLTRAADDEPPALRGQVRRVREVRSGFRHTGKRIANRHAARAEAAQLGEDVPVPVRVTCPPS